MSWTNKVEVDFYKSWEKMKIQIWWKTNYMGLVENENTKLWNKLRRDKNNTENN